MNQEESHIKIEEIKSPNDPSLPSKTTFKSAIKEIAIFAAIAIGIVLPFRIFIAEPYLVDGRSMDPTFSTGDYLIVDKLSYRIGEPKRNTVVVFKYPNDPKRSFIKRIIGLPGETVVIKDNTVKIINKDNPEGFTIDQSYIVHTSEDSITKTLGADEYFVMGDNRKNSSDSRAWGPVNEKLIIGRPIVRLLPIHKISIIPGKYNE